MHYNAPQQAVLGSKLPDFSREGAVPPPWIVIFPCPPYLTHTIMTIVNLMYPLLSC